MIPAIRTVMTKELRETLRDRRTLVNSLLIGPVVTIMLQLIAWAAMPGHEADPLRWLCNVGGSALGVALAAAATWLTARPRVPSA